MDKKCQQEFLRTLVRYKDDLNRLIAADRDVEVFFDIMSGGLVWTDETPENMPVRARWCLRPLFGYRTALIIGEEQEENSDYWNSCQAIFPNWIGFSKERCVSNPELLQTYRRGRVSLEKCLRRIERDTDEER